MRENDLISVILPIYNVEPYLERAVDSIIKQTYRNIEIIIINDDSTDRSLELCNSFAEQDSRIRVYTQVNSGPSVARNWGIKLANGDYVIFVDSDDYWMSRDNLQELVDMLHPEGILFLRGGYL